jgi:hypothetical protein
MPAEWYFRAAEKPLLPAEIRDRVQALGLPPQANLLASVHTTIKRMKEGGELKEISVPLQSGGTGTAYSWVSAAFKLADLIGNLDVAGAYAAAAQANQVRRVVRRHVIPHRRPAKLPQPLASHLDELKIDLEKK